MTAIVKYQIATYSGEVQVPCGPDDENETIIARAKRILKNQAGEFPFGYQSWRVESRP